MADLAAGTILAGTWRLVRTLGRGGMGVVWAAEHVQLGRPAAIKLLRGEFATDERSLLRFGQEAVAASRIGSPHIVGMLDSGTAPDGSPFLVMELLEGETLWEAMDGGAARLPVARVADILGQALTGIGAAHAQGIVHRDLKPENIFLTRLGGRPDFVKLLDFGLARVRTGDAGTRLTQTGVLLGTPSYMAPEQLLGSKDVDHRADLWSIGVILFRCLTGRRPFDGPTPADRIAAVASRPPTPLRALRPELDETLAALVQRALARRPEERFQTAEEFRTALAPYAAGCSSPYATSALAASFPPPGISPVPSLPGTAVAASVPPPTAAVAAPAPSWPGVPPATQPPRTASSPRRLWPWAVAALAVILAGAGVGWLIGRGGNDSAGTSAVAGPGVGADAGTNVGAGMDAVAVAPAVDGLSDRERYLRVNADVLCPGPDGRALVQLGMGPEYLAAYERVLRRYGMDFGAWSELMKRAAPDASTFAELQRRLEACGAQLVGPVPTVAQPASAPTVEEPDQPPSVLPADPAVRRELYIAVSAALACNNEAAGVGGPPRANDGSGSSFLDLLRQNGLSPNGWVDLVKEFSSLRDVQDTVMWRVVLCTPAATGATADVAADVPPAAPLSGDPFALRGLYLAAWSDWLCESRTLARRRSWNSEDVDRLMGETAVRHGLTLRQFQVLMSIHGADESAVREAESRAEECRRNGRRQGSGNEGDGEGAPDAASTTTSSPALNVHLH